MTTHSDISCLENSMDRETWWVIYSPWGRKNSDMPEHTLIHIVALQCYVNFFCIAKWIHSTYTHIPSFLGILSHLGHHGAHRRVLWAIEWKVKKPLSPVQLCDPMEYSLPGSSVHGILQARLLEWVAVPFSRGLPDPGIKPRSLPHCRQILYHLSYQGSLSYTVGSH